MPSLLDFLSNAGGQGMLGNFGGGGPQGDEEKQRIAMMWRNAMLGAPGMQGDPINFPNGVPGGIPGTGAPAGYIPPPQQASMPSNGSPQAPPPMMPGTAGVQPDPFSSVMPGQTAQGPEQLPPGATQVSLPLSAPAAAAPPGVRQQGFGDILNNNGALLMALGGGIAQHGVGGFLDAAKIAAANQPKWGVIGTDSMGNQQYGWIDPLRRTVTGAGPASGLASDPKDAQGNPLVGQAYLEHLRKNEPTTAAGVEGLLNGDIKAAGRNLQKLIPLASRVDPNFTTQIFQQRNTLATEAGKATPNTFGGQRNAGNTAIYHLGSVSEAAKDLNNVDVGQPDISHMINALRQHGSSEQSARANKLATELDRYVAEVGRFYAGSSSGGMAERAAARDRLGGAKTPAEFAAAIEGERELFQGKLRQLQDQRDTVFGGAERGDRIIGPVVQPHAKQGLDQIERNLGILRGNAPAAPAAGQAAAAPAAAPTNIPRVGSPAEAAKLPKGTRFMDPNGNMRIVP